MTQDFTEQNKSLTLGRGVNTDFTTTEVKQPGLIPCVFLLSRAGARSSINPPLTMR